MSIMNKALAAKIAKAKQVGPDMNEGKTGGGGYVPPAEGKNVRLRLVGYFELGKHKKEHGQGAGKIQDEVRLVWELSGHAWEPKDINGTAVPERLTMNLPYSLNEKANFFKLFKQLNAIHGNEATIMAELLGKDFMGDIEHNIVGEGPTKKTYANLRNIRKAERENDAGKIVPVAVPDPLTELKCFIIDIADLEMWDSIFIEGEYEAKKDKDGNVTEKARSKNQIQEKIKSALNWDKMPIAELLASGTTAEEEQSMDEALGGGDNDAPPFPTEERAGEPNLSDMV